MLASRYFRQVFHMDGRHTMTCIITATCSTCISRKLESDVGARLEPRPFDAGSRPDHQNTKCLLLKLHFGKEW